MNVTKTGHTAALIGGKLGHSYSPMLHALYGAPYTYELRELAPDDLGDFVANCPYDGFNVTIPYKKDIIPHLADLSEIARRLGSVNTVYQTEKGYVGDNTDYYGFAYTVSHSGIAVAGKKATVLGNGGVSPTVIAVLTDMGAREIKVISIEENNPETLAKHADTEILVNATPVGMYPNVGVAPCSLAHFPHLCAVYDLIYNPFETALMAEARLRGVPAFGGINMLSAQAKRAMELFLGIEIPDTRIAEVTETVVRQKRNVILIGMPGCGKSTLGKALAEKTGKRFVDLDAEIEQTAGKPIPEIFATEGEEAFRRCEHETAARICKESGCVIATGGGIVTREENLLPMQQNGILIFIDRAPEKLPTNGRPLSQAKTPATLYKERLPLYMAAADTTVDNNGAKEDTLAALCIAADTQKTTRGI